MTLSFGMHTRLHDFQNCTKSSATHNNITLEGCGPLKMDIMVNIKA